MYEINVCKWWDICDKKINRNFDNDHFEINNPTDVIVTLLRRISYELRVYAYYIDSLRRRYMSTMLMSSQSSISWRLTSDYKISNFSFVSTSKWKMKRNEGRGQGTSVHRRKYKIRGKITSRCSQFSNLCTRVYDLSIINYAARTISATISLLSTAQRMIKVR